MARKMPAHIVLPNGMWRFVKRGGRKTRTKATRSKPMSRYRRRYGRKHRRGGSRGLGLGGILNKGLIGKMAPGVLGLALGAGVGYYSAELSNAVPVNIPYKQPIVAVAGGGIPGLVGMFLRGGMGGGSAAW